MPVGYLETVLLYRNFAKAWQMFSEAEDKDKLPKHPLFEACMEIYAERAVERGKAHVKKFGIKRKVKAKK